MNRLVLWIVLAPAVAAAQTGAAKNLDELFSPAVWQPAHCNLSAAGPGALQATFWKGYEVTGFATTRLPAADWSSWKSFRFDVENPYPEPFSV